MDQAPSAQPSGASDSQPIINIRGEKVLLGPPSRELAAQFFSRWDNDFAVTVFAGDPLRPSSKDHIAAHYESASKDEQHDWVGFIIYEASTLRPIGATDLRHIDGVRRTAEFGISIGEKDCWSKGYGTETTILMLDYAFTALNLHNVMLDTFSYNERAIRAYQRAGFRILGRRREAQRIGGHLYDIVYMDCLSTEFHSPLQPVIPLP